MWYVIQTETGREQELVDAIDQVLCRRGYEQCFVIRHECVWRMGGGLKIHLEALFPSYVFAALSGDKEAEFFFHALKRVPGLTKLLGSADSGAGGYTFWTVDKEEEGMLRKMAGGDGKWIIRRSPVKVNEEGEIVWIGGALNEYRDRIVRKRLRKRCVTVEIPFLGRTRRVQMGISLEGDGL